MASAHRVTHNPLPRELAPGIFWLGNCLPVPYHGRTLHGYNSVFLVAGDDASLLVEAGNAPDLLVIETQLDALLARDAVPPLQYVFVSHSEQPHASGLGRLLGRFPSAVAVGSLLDLHLVFPQYQDRFRMMDPGDAVDLGGTEFVAVEAIIRDGVYTRWGFETRQRVLFSSDGFAYSHFHEDGHCGLLAEEAESLNIPEMALLFADLALYWTRFVDLTSYIDRLEEQVHKLGAQVIAPTHGLPISDIDATFPKIRDGLLLGGAMRGAEGAF
jgi:flavorubredoxin